MMSSMVLDGAAPRSRASDPVTSVDAGRSVNVNASQAAVLEAIERTMDHGITQGALEEFLSGTWSPSRIRSAVSELEDRGLVEATGETRATVYGRQARVYRAVKAVS
ncbi:MarR family transcriptional regulator [Leucobacter viscericola]|uniref:MarR family transcriptional regulator n=1 Tax=Leucobacter viscericola TaxID=2714935 RepID=A0A6G7XHX5_9MICO|nr:MarR family transcriptional regulator [Leucobacter viscericola]QIK64112.1 MarR family transcriptional regulator [Leucobacter viscericola]